MAWPNERICGRSNGCSDVEGLAREKSYAVQTSHSPLGLVCKVHVPGSSSITSGSGYWSVGSIRTVAKRRKRSAVPPICCAPFSHRETVDGSTPMCLAKSLPDQPKNFLRNRISPGSSLRVELAMLRASTRCNAAIAGIVTPPPSSQLSQRSKVTPIRVTCGSSVPMYG